MLLTSTHSQIKNDAPVLIVCYGERKRLMLKSHSYQEMIKLIRQKFNIESENENDVLLTVTLDECGGSRVEIDEDVWPVIRCIVDQVVVVVGMDNNVSAHSKRTDVDDFVSGPSEIVGASESVSGSSGRILADNDASVGAQGKEVVEENEREARVHVEQRVDANADIDHDMNGSEENVGNGRNVVEENVDEGMSMNEGYEYHDQFQIRGGSTQRSNSSYAENISHLRHSISQVQSHAVSQEINSSVIRSLGLVPKEKRFRVQVTGPGHNQAAEIKTRGEHTVKKVLAAVCKTFNLDYDQSVLYSFKRNQQLAIRCPYDWTMARCGITSKSTLIVGIIDQGRIRRSR